MLWSVSAIRKASAAETLNVLTSDAGKDALRAQLVSLFSDASVQDVILEVLKELLRQDEVAPLAQRVTQEVRQTVESLAGQFESEFKAARDKFKEDMRTAVIAQKASATRQLNDHIEQRRTRIASAAAHFEKDLKAALQAAKRRFDLETSELEDEAKQRLDAVIDEKFNALAADAVRRHLASKPTLAPEHTNRELASMNQISVREVKRRRRAALLQQGD